MARLGIMMNGKRISSLDDLRNNFSSKDMLAFYKAKRLHAWLEEQGLSDELENLNSFDAEMDDDTLLSMLIKVFALNDEQKSRAMATAQKDNAGHGELTISWDYCVFPEKYSSEFIVTPVSVDRPKLQFDESPFEKKPFEVRHDSVLFSLGYFGIVLSERERNPWPSPKFFKSLDGLSWKEDDELTETAPGYDRFVHGATHDFIFSKGDHHCLVSSDDGWITYYINLQGFGVEGIVDSPGGAILDLFEQDGAFGVLYLRDDGSRGLVLGKPFFDGRDQEFVSYDVPQYAEKIFYFRSNLYILNDGVLEGKPCFVVAHDQHSGFCNVLCGFVPEKIFVFQSRMFAFVQDNLFVTRDGNLWEECDLLASGEDIEFFQYGDFLLAFGMQKNSLTRYWFYSMDGKHWEKIAGKFDLHGYIAVGNEKILMCFGQQYFIGKIEVIK